ncbi:MAG TPA: protein-disulfide reductase DsbD N-terminal domain-containing protein [Casimicrobiaceae bacterium]|jgi:thiol:disulfide interchange protein DsbD|nr:protein-disulfide reductase DsbD N-terminal domain-containing protein [Casimicrobiaceae bacterium]
MARLADVGAFALACALAAGIATAQSIPGLQKTLLPADQAFRLSVRALDARTLEARFDIAQGYYLYRDKMHFSTDPVSAQAPALPAGEQKHDAFFGDVATYRGEVVVRIPLAQAAPGTTLTLHADSQGCADVGVCYPPNPQQLTVAIPATKYPGPFVEAGGKKWFK